MNYLYVLIDPRDGRLRYVGQTTRLANRRSQYASAAHTDKPYPAQRWLRKLEALGLQPVFVPVAIAQTHEQLDALEIAWIAFMRMACSDLLNVSSGGLGCRGVKWSAERRANAKGRAPWNKGVPVTDSARQRMRAAKLGTKQSQATIDKRRLAALGHTVSTVTRQRISQALTGKTLPATTRQKIATTLTGRKASDATRAKLRAAQQARRIREAGDE